MVTSIASEVGNRADCAVLDDPFKALEDIFQPDSRQANFVEGLDECHADLMSMSLHEGVPPAVRQLFETAKNVSLYSWFVYPFHQVAEMVAYSALEYALRLRAEKDGLHQNAKGRKLTLSGLLTISKQNSWISNTAYSSLHRMAVERARQKISFAAVAQSPNQDEWPLPDPTADQIRQAKSEIDIGAILCAAVPSLRNSLAHGSQMLAPTSRITLRLIVDTIAQLFPLPSKGSS